MSVPSRKTRECSINDLRPEIVSAIREHAELYKLGNIETNLLICCETTSTEKKGGFFNSGSETTIGVVLLAPEWLIVAAKRGNEEPAIISGQLRNIQVHNFEDSAMFKINPDAGLNITGRYSDVTKQGMAFIGLGPEPAAQKFRQVLREAIEKVGH